MSSASQAPLTEHVQAKLGANGHAIRLPGVGPGPGAARVAVLVASDVLALLLAGTAAFLLWAQPVRGQGAMTYLPTVPMVLVVVLAYGQVGLYPGFGLGPVEILRKYWLVTAAAFLAATSLVLVLKIENVYSRVTLAIALLLSLLLVPILRGVTSRLVRRWRWWPEPVVLVGCGRRTKLAQQLLDQRGAEFRAVASIDVAGELSADDFDHSEIATRGAELARAGVRLAFADVDGDHAEAALDRIMLVFPRVIILRDFAELPVEGVAVRNLGGVLGLEYGSNLLRRQSRWVKRSLDVALGTMLLVMTLPVMLIAMLAVKLFSPGPALFWQIREGRGGRLIHVPKIRTMVPGADRRMEELFLTDPALRGEWESGFKLHRDPRIIPRIGRLLRRSSIDELPQLWNVLSGDMSLVGPRPFPDYHLDALTPQARRLRNQVRPGITGLWQVTSRGAAGVEAQQSHDIYYIRNWSLWLDLYILARTVAAVLSGRGAY